MAKVCYAPKTLKSHYNCLHSSSHDTGGSIVNKKAVCYFLHEFRNACHLAKNDSLYIEKKRLDNYIVIYNNYIVKQTII